MSTATAVSFKTKASSGEGNFEMPPSGSHPAIMIGLIDLGTRDSTFNPGKKHHTIRLVWELTAESDSEGKNFIVAQDFTWSLNVKAALRPIVDGFRGTSLKDDEEYDLAMMLDQPCMISLSEATTGNGKKYMEVMGITKPPRGLTVPPVTHKSYLFHWEAIHSTKDDFKIPYWMPNLYGVNLADHLKTADEFGVLPAF